MRTAPPLAPVPPPAPRADEPRHDLARPGDAGTPAVPVFDPRRADAFVVDWAPPAR